MFFCGNWSGFAAQFNVILSALVKLRMWVTVTARRGEGEWGNCMKGCVVDLHPIGCRSTTGWRKEGDYGSRKITLLPSALLCCIV